MARTIKRGLDYFPFDVDFFQDIRIRKLIKYQGGKSVTVYALLLCTIYRNGYYAEWDKELPFIISEQSGYTEAYIQEVIDCCLNIGLFSRELFDSAKILTSKGIQIRYRSVCSRRNSVIEEYDLIEPITNESKPVKQTPVTGVKASQQKTPLTAPVKYDKSVKEEIALLKKDVEWSNSVCEKYALTADRLGAYLDDFALVCPNEHSSMQDCKSHFCRWLARKSASPKVSKAIDAAVEREKEREERRREEQEHASKVVHPDDYLKSRGLKPGTSMVELARQNAVSDAKDALPEDVLSDLEKIKKL